MQAMSINKDHPLIINSLNVSVQVYSFGNGSGVGKGTTEPRQYTPWLIEALDSEVVIDISTGDGHCLALTQSECYWLVGEGWRVRGGME